MMRIQTGLLFSAVLTVGQLCAQSVEQGKKFFGYERYNSAKDQFEKVLAANPSDPAATFWLTETYLELKDTAAAKALVQRSLAANGNSPMALVSMGRIELLEGKTADARQRFETALSLTKSKDMNVINGIGYAVVNSRQGDPAYVIEKLTPITQQKDFKDPNTWIVIGDAYRRMVDGGNAVQSYQKALVLDPKNAAAKHRIGKIYLTQKNTDIYVPAFEEAANLDPNYAPAYYELYYHYFYKDINKAKDFYDKFLAVSDPSPSNDYEKTSILFASQRYDEAITTAQGFINQLGANADPRYYKLIAYSYDAKKDSVNAKSWLDQYFAKQKPENLVPQDYVFRAKTLSKFPGSEKEALASYGTAINMDTTYDSKMELLYEASAYAKKSGNRVAEANWLGQIYATKKKPVNTDLYNWGFANYQAGDYKQSDAIFTQYVEKYPNEIFGYLWRARSNQAMDTSMVQGLAVPHYEKLAEQAMAIDPVKYKSQAINANFYLAQYYNDIKKDKPAAITYLDKILAIDPANAPAQSAKDALSKAGKAPAAPPKKPATTGKPAGK